MIKYSLLIVFLFTNLIGYAQLAEITDNWQTNCIKSKNEEDLYYHVYKNEIGKKKPLLLYLEGSGNFPLFYEDSLSRISSSITMDYREISETFHFVVISKPGVPLTDRIEIDAQGRSFYPTNDYYHKVYSLNWRVNAGNAVISNMIKKYKVDKRKVIVWGHSEGAQVAPAIATKNGKVTHVVSMMGNALNHFYDIIIKERLAAINGNISNEEAQKNVDSLFNVFREIYSDPNSTSKEWYGETFLKWSSFTLSPPLDNMLKLDIPILYIAGGADKNQNIINMDFAQLAFLSRGKNNLTYKVFPNCDHYFMESKIDELGNQGWLDRMDEVNAYALEWLNQ